MSKMNCRNPARTTEKPWESFPYRANSWRGVSLSFGCVEKRSVSSASMVQHFSGSELTTDVGVRAKSYQHWSRLVSLRKVRSAFQRFFCLFFLLKTLCSSGVDVLLRLVTCEDDRARSLARGEEYFGQCNSAYSMVSMQHIGFQNV